MDTKLSLLSSDNLSPRMICWRRFRSQLWSVTLVPRKRPNLPYFITLSHCHPLPHHYLWGWVFKTLCLFFVSVYILMHQKVLKHQRILQWRHVCFLVTFTFSFSSIVRSPWTPHLVLWLLCTADYSTSNCTLLFYSLKNWTLLLSMHLYLSHYHVILHNSVRTQYSCAASLWSYRSSRFPA